MMSDRAIFADGLGKQYRIGVGRDQYYTFREAVMNALRKSVRRLSLQKDGAAPDNDLFWALTNVSFEIGQGEMVGIIGRNGAGKSTLLKILSRITEPTTGLARIYGRIGSLLEVGTGFHPELTGRENVFLHGAVLGMTKKEIRRKFDEIVDFSGIEKFLDTPVKRYSSGMYVRLAFSVAAHLECEILLVDEVLAVGDAAFQKKCMGKMGEVAGQGRTVLIVSHNMGAISRLCSRSIWLDNGLVVGSGNTADVVREYLASMSDEGGERRWDDLSNAPGDDNIRLTAVRIVDDQGNVSSSLDIRLPFHVDVEYEVLKSLPIFRVAFRLSAADGTIVLTSMDIAAPDWDGSRKKPGHYVSRCRFPGNFLNEGQYHLYMISGDICWISH